jgi:hypothetical protein
VRVAIAVALERRVEERCRVDVRDRVLPLEADAGLRVAW